MIASIKTIKNPPTPFGNAKMLTQPVIILIAIRHSAVRSRVKKQCCETDNHAGKEREINLLGLHIQIQVEEKLGKNERIDFKQAQ